MEKIRYFKLEEFACKCGKCNSVINLDFLRKLDKARGIAGVPFFINSGCRCDNYNSEKE